MWDTYNTQHLYKLTTVYYWQLGRGMNPLVGMGSMDLKILISRLTSSWIHQEQSTIDQLSGHRMTKQVHPFTSLWRSSDGNCRENERPNKPRQHPLFTLISHKQSQCNNVYMQQIANVLLILALKSSRFLIRVMPHRLLREARSRQTTGLTIEHTKRTVKW